MKEIKVQLKDNSYKILIGNSILTRLHEFINFENKKVLAVIDENVFKYFDKKLTSELSKVSKGIKIYLVKSGEKTKSYSEVQKIHSFMLSNNFGRDSIIVAIGGGVTGDLVGFAASTFMRGIKLIHIPTTLLAAVDSSIGGKTGINFNHKKNMIGTFYQPELVFIDIQFFKTLPPIELTSGIGEIIKYAYLADKEFFQFLQNSFTKIYEQEPQVLTEIILKSAGIKASVVSQDEKETGLRKILNLGHTFAHAFESALDFKIKHGEAVSAGLVSALYLSEKLKLITKTDLNEFLELPLRMKMNKKLKALDKDKVLEIMKSDKKNYQGKIKFVLIAGIGNILIDMEASNKDIYWALGKMQEYIM